MTNKKILLVIPEKESQYGEPRYPVYGIGMIASVLRKAGFEPSILDMRLGLPKGRSILDHIEAVNPNLIGMTVTNWDFNEAVFIARIVKNHHPDLPIIFGGPQASLCLQESIGYEEVDYVVFGEGEETAVELCSALRDDLTDLSGIKGLAWKKDEQIVINSPRPLISDLNTLPLPAFDLFPLERYKAAGEFRLSILTSRGCPFGCTFCTSRATMGRTVRLRNPILVVDEIEHWHRNTGADHFAIHDDNFLINKVRARIFFLELLKRKLPVTYSLDSGIRADCADPELFRMMKETGCALMAIGVESADPEVLRLVKKGETVEQIRYAITEAKKAGLLVKGYFIIGLPGDTAAKAMKNFDFAVETGIDIPRFALIQAFPHTELADWVRENGNFLYEPYDYVTTQTDGVQSEVHYEIPGFNKEEMWSVYKRLNLKAEAYFFRNILLRKFGRVFGTILSALFNHRAVRAVLVFAYRRKWISLPK